MTGQEAVELIHREAWTGRKPGLSRTLELLSRVGNPHEKLNYVHITGTNGKGSTTAMLNSILTCAGYRAGMFVSPYVLEFRERIQIGGEMIPKEELVRIVQKIKPVIDRMYEEGDGPVQFEVVTAIGFVYFVEQKCDVVCLEVGIGGLKDSTNIIREPLAAVIANIGLDHTNMLGNTVEEIAAQKAGIIKGKCPVCVYPGVDPKALAVIMEKCAENGSTLIQGNFRHADILRQDINGTVFTYNSLTIRLPLLGQHQVCNAINVIETVRAIRGAGFRVSDEQIVRGIGAVKFPARTEILCKNPLTIVDGAHNDNGAEALEAVIKDILKDRPLVLIMGMMGDKDCQKVVRRLAALADAVIAVTPSLEYRALPKEELAKLAGEVCQRVELGDGFRQSWLRAAELIGEKGTIVICGSLYLATDMRDAVLALLRENSIRK